MVDSSDHSIPEQSNQPVALHQTDGGFGKDQLWSFDLAHVGRLRPHLDRAGLTNGGWHVSPHGDLGGGKCDCGLAFMNGC